MADVMTVEAAAADAPDPSLGELGEDVMEVQLLGHLAERAKAEGQIGA